MHKKCLTLPQKVFVVKNYYQITDMCLVRRAFQRSYEIETGEEILDTFFNLVSFAGCWCTGDDLRFRKILFSL